MGQEQFVVEGALVLCTMAQQPAGDWMGNYVPDIYGILMLCEEDELSGYKENA